MPFRGPGRSRCMWSVDAEMHQGAEPAAVTEPSRGDSSDLPETETDPEIRAIQH